MRHQTKKFILTAVLVVFSTICCKPSGNSDELLNSNQLSSQNQYIFLDQSNVDICYREGNFYLDRDESTTNSNSIESLSEIEIYSIFNQLEHHRVSCQGEVDLSGEIISGFVLPTDDQTPQMALNASAISSLDKLPRLVNGLRQVATRLKGGHAYLRIGTQSQARKIAVRPPPAGQQSFLTSQLKLFRDAKPEAKDRLWRYYKGQRIYNRPISSFGKVLDPLPGELPNPRLIKFGQASVSDSFSDAGKVGIKREMLEDGQIVGRSIKALAKDLRSGKISVDSIKIKVFKYQDKKGSIHWVTANNRSLTAIRAAGLEPTNIKILTREKLIHTKDTDNLESVLNRLVAMPSELPSMRSYIRVAGKNPKGEMRNSWEWDAPFGVMVGQ